MHLLQLQTQVCGQPMLREPWSLLLGNVEIAISGLAEFPQEHGSCMQRPSLSGL